MRPQQKNNRNRIKTNRPKAMGNVTNRVFESAGPEGKVRGTPQQIVEKYEQLSRDATLSGDRVMAENFLQHAEHYARLLSAAQAELQSQADAEQRRQAEHQQRQAEQQSRVNDQPRQDRAETAEPRQDAAAPAPRRGRQDRAEQPRAEQPHVEQPRAEQPHVEDRAPRVEPVEPTVLAVQDDADAAGLVPTPEADAAAKPRRRRSPRRAARAEGDAQPAADASAAPDEGVRRTAERGRRRPKAEAPADDAAPTPDRSEAAAT